MEGIGKGTRSVSNSLTVAFELRFRRPPPPPPAPSGRLEFRTLVAECEPRLRAKAIHLCRSARTGSLDAEDLLQDTYERALRAFATYDARQPFQAWLATILVNRFLDFCRAQKRHPQEQLTEEMDMARDDEQEAAPWASFTLEDVARASERLPEEFRDVVRLRDVDGLSYAEIARRLGIAPMTVGTRLHRGRKRLKELMLNPDGAPDDLKGES